MAVPKKRTSKAKSKKAQWKNKALLISKQSLSIAKSLLTNQATSYIYLNTKSLIDN